MQQCSCNHSCNHFCEGPPSRALVGVRVRPHVPRRGQPDVPMLADHAMVVCWPLIVWCWCLSWNDLAVVEDAVKDCGVIH